MSIRSVPQDFLDSLYDQYYQPGEIDAEADVEPLHNSPSKRNGVNALYFKNGSSRGHFNKSEAIEKLDSKDIISVHPKDSVGIGVPEKLYFQSFNEQVVLLIAPGFLRDVYGSNMSNTYRIIVNDHIELRARIVHFVDLFPSETGFFSTQQFSSEALFFVSYQQFYHII